MHSLNNSSYAAATALMCVMLLCVGSGISWGAETAPPVRFTDAIPMVGGTNLVPNGSFEVGEAGWSSLGHGAGYENLWAPLVPNWGNFAALHGTVEVSGGAEGQAFLRIPLGAEHTPVFNFDYFRPVNHRELRPLAANRGWIEVTPGEPYTISVAMRASREGIRAAIGVQNEDAGQGWDGAQEEILKRVTLGTQWQRHTHTFVPKYRFVFVLAGPDLTQEEQVAVDVDAVQLEKGREATPYTARSGVEIGVIPSAPGGVFTAGEASLKILAHNSTGTPAPAEVRFRVVDFFDEPVELPSIGVEVPAASTVEQSMPLPAQWQGFYRVEAIFRSSDVEETRLLRVAIVPPRTTRDTVIGVNHAYSNPFLIGLAKKAGVNWYRDWSLKWQHIEPEQGKYQWEVSDPQMNRVVAQDVNLMAMIPFPSADWNSTAPDLETLRAESPRYNAGGKGDDQELIPRARWAWAPRDVSELTDFVSAVVSRYEKQIQVWEFLNEPLYTSYVLPDNNALESTTLEGHTVDDYLTLLRAAVPAIRASNPNARIMGGPGASVGAYTIQMLEAGVLDLVDIYGVHDYPVRTKPEERLTSNDALLEAMAAHGGVKPMWMTEFSYFGTDDLPRDPFIPIPGLWSETKLLSEREVAEYTVRYCTIFLGRGGEKVFLHSGCTGSVNKPGTESCMFSDGAVRKVFPAMAVFTEFMGANPEHVADSAVGTGLVFGFETGTRAVVLAWDPDAKTSATLPPETTCFDIMGRIVDGPSVPLTASPVYVIGSAGTAKTLVATCAESMQ